MIRIASLLLSGMLLATLLSSPLNAQRDKRRGSAGGDPTDVGSEAVDSPAEQVWRTRAGEVEQRSMDRPTFVSGKVLMDDGSALPDTVMVNLVCQGSVRQQAATFGDGSFNLELASDLKSMDASVSGNEADSVDAFARVPGAQGYSDRELDLRGCELRTALAGFRSNSIKLGRRSSMENSDVGIIVLQRLGEVSGLTVSFTTLRAPKKARKAYDKARQELKKPKGDISKAIKQLEKAVKTFPEFAAAWYLLGTSRLALKKESEARDSFDRAIQADPNYVNPFLSLAELEMKTQNWPEVTRLCETVIALNPHIIEAQYFNAVASLNLKKLDSAQESAEKVQAAGPSQFLAGSHYVLGAVLAEKQEYDSASREFQLFLQTSPGEPIESQLKETLMGWEKLGLMKSAGASETAHK